MVLTYLHVLDPEIPIDYMVIIWLLYGYYMVNDGQ